MEGVKRYETELRELQEKKYKENRALDTSGKAEFIQAVYDKIENEQCEEVFPNYYHKFKCIADKCKHSCCIGWEIDIDDDTMQLYNSLGGALCDGDFRSRVRFALIGCYLIGALFSANTEEFYEVVRMYSSEIEYSEENTEALIGSYTYEGNVGYEKKCSLADD